MLTKGPYKLQTTSNWRKQIKLQTELQIKLKKLQKT